MSNAYTAEQCLDIINRSLDAGLDCGKITREERIAIKILAKRIFGKLAYNDANIVDAARYRWLRAQHWSTSRVCAVVDPKRSVILGNDCPSG